jgi:hypothetical protein
MGIRIHPHARERMAERGATDEEVIATLSAGESFPAKLGRQGFRRNFNKTGTWRSRPYAIKQVEAIAVREGPDWLVITVIVRYY